MSEVKLEVGQIWESNISSCKILDLFTLNGCEHVVISLWVACRFNGVDHVKVDELFATNLKLVTNADGTPAEKPKKYKELTPVEAMRLLADAGEPIECEVSNNQKHWDEVQLFGVEFISDHRFHTSNDVYKYCRIEVTND